MTRFLLLAGLVAPALFLLALLTFGGLAAGYDHGRHAIALLGAAGVPHAAGWNLFGYVLPGLGIAALGFGLEKPMAADGARLGGRLGSTLVMISGVTFAAQGLFPYAPDAPDDAAAQWHASLYTISLLAFLPAALFVAGSLRGRSGWRALSVWGPALAAALFLSLAWPPGELIPALAGKPGYLQRLALGLYLGWMVLAALTALRRSR